MIHYSLVKLPDGGYKPRLADDRVGQFLSAVKDFGQENTDTQFVRQINRWRLEKSDPKKALSTPKKQIVWWVEDTVPHEYRPFVEEGILEWNKAFEKIGFRNALAVRWQDGTRDEFDPEDINYCTFRWITSPSTFAMSCLRANPITGEMIDGDVIFDASFVRYWKRDYAILTGTAPASAGGADADAVPLDVGEVISPIMAAKHSPGYPPRRRCAAPARPRSRRGVRTSGSSRPSGEIRSPCCTIGSRAAGWPVAQFNSGLRPEMTMAAMALADAGKADEAGKIPEEFLGQMIKEVVMHEVGHSLGLRHNFHASTMLTADQLNDTTITRVKGQSGSVMDYNPINIVPKGQKQGDYVTTTIGPYDYWAIEYAYKPIDGDEAAELKKIAARSPDPDLAYATDEDMSGNDPLVNAYDLGSDPSRFALDRITLAAQLMKDLDSRVVKDGESWARARSAFVTLLNQWGNSAYLLSSFVGGQNVSPRSQGGQGFARPDRPRPRLEAARGVEGPERAGPQRPGVPVLARPAPQARRRALVSLGESLARRGRLPDPRARARDPEDRAQSVPGRRHVGEAPESGADGRRGERAVEDVRGLPDPHRRHLVGTGRALGGGEGQAVFGRPVHDAPQPPAGAPAPARAR